METLRVRANRVLTHRSKKHRYSITSSSRASRRQTGAMLEAEAKFKGEKRQISRRDFSA
jgi:hypothetical protein